MLHLTKEGHPKEILWLWSIHKVKVITMLDYICVLLLRKSILHTKITATTPKCGSLCGLAGFYPVKYIFMSKNVGVEALFNQQPATPFGLLCSFLRIGTGLEVEVEFMNFGLRIVLYASGRQQVPFLAQDGFAVLLDCIWWQKMLPEAIPCMFFEIINLGTAFTTPAAFGPFIQLCYHQSRFKVDSIHQSTTL